MDARRRRKPVQLDLPITGSAAVAAPPSHDDEGRAAAIAASARALDAPEARIMATPNSQQQRALDDVKKRRAALRREARR
jgi:hypothetical protein